ncbi:unnamed protein product [Paramecium pentaurelia]|uniref:Uncharacterized protein n=1 Tax=Paramecium pentaurelia TaxID=43138 RepID=A0A8S1U0E8_9CILI|nr:unnamed protein product [Paramecium pentaurelia]
MSKNKSKEQVNNSQANISKNGSQAQLNQSKSQSSINNQSVLNQSLKDELNKSKTNEQVQQENHEDKLNQSQQNKNYTISAKSWDLNQHEVKFLNDLYGEIQEAQLLAEGLQDENKFENEQIELAQKDINTVQNVIEMLKEESDKEDDIRFAIDNALLNLATTKRKTEDENDKLRDLVRQRNAQLRMLVIKVKDQDQQLKQKDEQIKRLEQQVQQQGQTLRQLQNKVEDEYRIKVVQEQLRKPRENKLFDESKFVDVNAKDDPFDFWQNNAIREYPGEPKKLNDVVQKKTLWVAQKEDEKLNKFEYSKMPKSNESNFWGK